MTAHFYTADLSERQNAIQNLGFSDEGIACYVFSAPAAGPAPLFRACHPPTGAHVYTMSMAERDNATNNLGYTAEGIACYIYGQQPAGATPLYCAYQPASDDHFYTTDLAEHNNAVQKLGYNDEGIAGYVLSGAATGTVPLYRLVKGTHFYTADLSERQNAIQNLGFSDEGIACYVFSAPAAGPAPLFRACHPPTGAHVYTMSMAERDNATNNLGYTAEGIACYIYGQQPAGATPLYRAYQPASDDHFYTTDLAEHNNAVQKLGYNDEGVTGDVLASVSGGTVPFYRMYGPSAALRPDQQLNVDQQLIAANNRLNLVLQRDGNLVLYRTMFNLPLFASWTNGKPVNRAVMQSDGNLVLYGPDGTAYWDTGTWGHPGAWMVLQDDGNLVVYSPAGQPLWSSNSVQNWNSPTVRYQDNRGYSFDETSESWKQLCRSLPCFLALQWPDYATAKFEVTLKNQPAVIQAWKGWCPKFVGLQDFPGGNGGEVGVYRRIPGHARPTALPGIPQALASLILTTLGTLTDSQIWWPAPDLADTVGFSLINPVNNTTFFTSGAERTYWNCKWMEDASYSQYQRDTSNTPAFPTEYRMNLEVNGQSFVW